eukprot:gene2070-2556_t
MIPGVKYVEVVPDDELMDDDDVENDDGDEDQQQPQQEQEKQDNKPVIKKNRKLKTIFKPETEIGPIFTGGSVDLSNDSKSIATQCGDKINFVDLETGKITSTIQLDSKITTFKMSPNNHQILVGCIDLQMKQYRIEDKELIKVWKGHDGPINSIDFHSSGVLAATGSSDRTVKIWDLEKGYCTHNFTEGLGVVSIVKFHPKKLQVISVSDDLNIRVWDLQTNNCLVLSNHLSMISAITFSNFGTELISAGTDKVLNVWDMKSSSPKKTIPIFIELSGLVTLPSNFGKLSTTSDTIKAKLEKIKSKLEKSPQHAEKFAKEGMTIVLGGNNQLKAWCTETGEEVWSDAHKEINPITNIIINKETLVSVTQEHNLLVYDMDYLKRMGEYVGYNDEIVDIKYLGDSEIVVATNSNEVKIFDLHNKKSKILRGHTELVMSLDVSFDNQIMVTGSRDNTVILWDMVNMEPMTTFTGHTASVTCVALPNKQKNFAISASDDRTVKLWKLASNSKEQNKSSNAVAQITKIAHEKDINCLSIAPNDKIFATASQDTYVKIWSVNNLEVLASIKAHRRGVWSVEFSPVDLCFLTSSADGTIKIWSLNDYTCLKTLEGHTGSVLRASFITYGMQIVSAGADGLIKLWNIKTNECVNTFEGHDSRIWALTVNKDQFITGASDSKIIVWNDHTVLDELLEKEKQEKIIKQKQSLDSALRQKDYFTALKLALILDQPQQTLHIFTLMYEESGGTDLKIRENIKRLFKSDVIKLLRYIRSWNTNSKFVSISQIVLNTLITSFTPDELIELSPSEIPRLLESLIPYTERHFQRIDKMLQKTYLIDFTISTINPSANTLLVDEIKKDEPHKQQQQKKKQPKSKPTEEKEKEVKEEKAPNPTPSKPQQNNESKPQQSESTDIKTKKSRGRSSKNKKQQTAN